MSDADVRERTAAHDQPADFVIVRWIDRLSEATGALSTLALLFMTAIVCFEVFSRYVLGEPTSWVAEVSTYVLVGMTYMALAAAQRQDSHIQVELVLTALRKPTRQQVELVAAWVGLFFVVFTAWQMALFNYSSFVHGERSWGLMATPLWIPQLPVSIGYVVFALAILADIYRLRPPATAIAKWLVPALFLGLALLLYLLGPEPVRIAGSRFDWGTISIAVTFVLAMLTWSGVLTTLATALVCGGLTMLFWLGEDMALLPVSLLLIAAMLALLLLGVRVALALGTIGMFGLFFLLPSPQLSLLAERSWSSLNTFTLAAVPMFVLMGAVLLRSGVATEMFDALMKWFGRVPGGIAHAGIGGSTIFAAVSGSSLATAATMGTVACPEMVKRGYSPRLTYGSVAAGATLGILVPPSIAMIIYGTTVGAPVTVLFIAGIVPGLILMLMFMACVFVWSAAFPSAAPTAEAYPWREKIGSSLGVLPFGFVIVAVLGSLYAGIATPTEAGGVGSAMAILLCLARRKLTWDLLYQSAIETVRVTAFLLLIIVGASILSWVFDYLRLPRTMVEVVQAAELAPFMVMAAIGLLYIVMGMFIDPISMMLMTLPITFPLVTSFGFDAIWFGVTLVLLIEVALITPPVGIVLFVLRGMSGDVPLKEIVYGVVPFVFMILGFLVLVYVFPEIIGWLPSQMDR